MEEVKEGLEEVGQFCDEIDRDWQRLKEHCESYDVLTKSEPDVVEGDVVRSVCLVVGGGLVYGGAANHPECADYWVNCVRDTLASWSEMGHITGGNGMGGSCLVFF